VRYVHLFYFLFWVKFGKLMSFLLPLAAGYIRKIFSDFCLMLLVIIIVDTDTKIAHCTFDAHRKLIYLFI